MQTQEAFFLEHQVDGALTDMQTMQMLNLQEGDSSAANAPQSSVPDADIADQPSADTAPAAAADETAAAAADDEKAQVILARDGVHTIPFEKLQQARQGEQHYRELAEQMQTELQALKQAQQTQPAAAQAADPATADTAELFGDFSEAGMKAGIEKLVAQKTALMQVQFDEKLAAFSKPFVEQQAKTLADSHFSAIEKAHPDVDALVQSREMAAWIASKPAFLQGGYQSVIDGGTSAEVIELLDNYKSETQPRTTASTSNAAQAAAQSAIAKAKFAPPTSLSEIPAGSAAHHDEAEAILGMSDSALMLKFESMTAAQRNTLLSRI